ncbi:MAG: hypothetical protein E7006_02500 [Alphaproteobacteria bacterium]|nr:hypothetical protein [Alphaproteobacteria bacterium]
MTDYVNNLIDVLQLSQYQASKLRAHYDRYNIARLEKRGGVLYAPYANHNVWEYFSRMIFGSPADLIGQNKTLLRAQRNIKFCENGYHCVKVGRYTYYADATGNIISKSEFLRNTNR